jgi:hypothetical protein
MSIGLALILVTLSTPYHPAIAELMAQANSTLYSKYCYGVDVTTVYKGTVLNPFGWLYSKYYSAPSVLNNDIIGKYISAGTAFAIIIMGFVVIVAILTLIMYCCNLKWSCITFMSTMPGKIVQGALLLVAVGFSYLANRIAMYQGTVSNQAVCQAYKLIDSWNTGDSTFGGFHNLFNDLNATNNSLWELDAYKNSMYYLMEEEANSCNTTKSDLYFVSTLNDMLVTSPTTTQNEIVPD